MSDIWTTIKYDANVAKSTAELALQNPGLVVPQVVSRVTPAMWIAGGAGLLMVLLFSGKHRVRRYR